MELTLFIIVGAVAVISAAMMLVSENAVHSALFLIMNFMCIAFFFLMLNAAFLAMVQITVYAGAIMVLFLFVIMLLGAEKLLPEMNPRFPWLAPVAVGLALLFLLVTSLVIIRGDINLSLPKNDRPSVRVVNAMDGADAIDVYLNDERIAENLAFGRNTNYADRIQGDSRLTVFQSGADPNADTPMLDQVITLKADNTFTLVAAGTSSSPRVFAVEEDPSSVSNKDKLRVMAVNAIQGVSRIDITRGEDRDNILIDNVNYGEISDATTLVEGDYNVTVYRDDDMRTRWHTFGDKTLDAETGWLWIFASQHQSDNSVAERMIPVAMNIDPSFGGPAHVGELLFNRYVLPFEMVSLVLLAAMIGAIVLTHDVGEPRRANVRRLANPPAGLEKPITEKKRD
jgi:NADH:ubiquinone oxidoreductase subunit 6 (subunit J)